MESLNKDLIQHLCKFLEIGEAARLKQVCRHFNKCIQIFTVRMFCCLTVDNLPAKSKYNCVKLCVRFHKHEISFERLQQLFYSKELSLLAAVIYGDSNKNKTSFGTGEINFKPTTIVIDEDLNCDIDDDCECVSTIINCNKKLTKEHITYMEKEIRLIQREAWKFPRADAETFLFLNGVSDEITLICPDGDLKVKTLEVLDNLISIF